MTNTEPMFRLQIVDREGVVARLPGGGLLERALVESFAQAIVDTLRAADGDLTEAAVRAIVAKGVGVFRTEAHVAEDIRAGLAEVFGSKNSDFSAAVSAGITAVIRDLKRQTIAIA